jgi:hypothetical protein
VSWKEDTAARLLGDPAVMAIIAADAVEWDALAPDTPLPALMLQVISDPRPQTHDGFDAFRGTRVQVNAIAMTAREADALLDAAVEALVRFAEQGGTTFLRSFVDNGGSDSERTPTGRRNRARADLIIWHN